MRHFSPSHRRWVALIAVAAMVLPSVVQGADPESVPPPRPAAAEQRGDAEDSTTLGTPQAVTGYAVGLRIGSRIAADFKTEHPDIPPAALARGLADAIRGVAPSLSEAEIRQALEQFDALMEKRGEAFAKRMEETAQANRAKAGDFLRANGVRPGVVTRPSGLQYEVLKAGTGPQPTLDDVVSTHYRGTHLDGKEFDATDPRGEPATFPVRGVVPGWQEALQLMKVGSKWRLYVPPELGYGEAGSPPVIEPNEVLVFEIELVRIDPRR
jgi:FKBP-type peptidyl-prolyl cis-trans isomerase FklB